MQRKKPSHPSVSANLLATWVTAGKASRRTAQLSPAEKEQLGVEWGHFKILG